MIPERKRIKIGRTPPVFVAAAREAPRRIIKCPRHDLEMGYNPAEDRWECMAVDRVLLAHNDYEERPCTTFKRRPTKFSNIFSNNGGVPAVYCGRLEIKQDEDGGLWLYLVDSHGMVDLSRLVMPEVEGMQVPLAVLAMFLDEPGTTSITYNGAVYTRGD